MQFPITRMRRLRKNSKIRDIVRETKLQKEDLIYPIYFIILNKIWKVMRKKRYLHFQVNSDTL